MDWSSFGWGMLTAAIVMIAVIGMCTTMIRKDAQQAGLDDARTDAVYRRSARALEG